MKQKKIILIKNALVINPSQNFKSIANLYIEGKRILKISKELLPDLKISKTIDASGLMVCPGLIDLQATCCEPAYEHVSNIAIETKASTSAGITSLVCPPDNNLIIEDKQTAELIISRARQANLAHVLPVGAMTKQLQGTHLSEMFALKKSGCVAISNGDSPIDNIAAIINALKYAKTVDLPVIVKPLEGSLFIQGAINEGKISSVTGLPSNPRESELIALTKYLYLVKKINTRVHFTQLSCAESVELIKNAKDEGLPVTADVSINHLFFTEDKVKRFDSIFHIQPPLRLEKDKKALRKGLQDGIIDAISSNHKPWLNNHKDVTFADSKEGASGVDTLWNACLKLQTEEGWQIEDVLSMLTNRAASCLNLESGNLNEQSKADIFIFDPSVEKVITIDMIKSNGKNNPFIGQRLLGEVHYTFKSGKLVFNKKTSSDS